MYRTQKLINQFLNQVPNLVKCMRVVCENNERGIIAKMQDE